MVAMRGIGKALLRSWQPIVNRLSYPCRHLSQPQRIALHVWGSGGLMAFGRRRHEAGRPWRLSAKWLILCSLIIVAGFAAICVDVVMDLRRGEETLVRRTLENLASGIDADISRNIELYDLSLRAVASSMVTREIKNVSKPIRQLILFDRAANAKHFGAIQVFDS